MSKKLWSVFTDDMDHCYFTGTPYCHRHHIFYGPYRSMSEKYGFVIPMAKEARKMLADEDINIPDELVMNLVAEDADGTKAAVEAFSTMYKEAVQKAVKDALKGKPPKAGNGGDKPPMTKGQILAVKNPSERQKLIAENITLFQ